MKAFIYVGGDICPQRITDHPQSDDLRIAADSGYHNALLLGDKVDILLGDLDSIKADIPDGVELVKVPAEKDFSDAQLAISAALEKGADEIVIIGGISGRLDHTLANLSLLAPLQKAHVYAYITDGYNRVRYLESTSTLVARSQFKYLSILPIDEKLKGVSIEGCKYPLENATLTKQNASLSISNEIEGNCAFISVRKGACYVIESIDRDNDTQAK